MIRKNYRSDFVLTLTPKTISGENVDILPDGNFGLEFECGGRKYVCSRIDGEYSNCCVNDDGTIACVFDNHDLLPGIMRMAAWFDTTDSLYGDGARRSVIPARSISIELVKDGGDEETSFDIGLVLPYAIITAYQMAVAQGYTGTEEDWVKLMLKGTSIGDVLSVKELQSERITNNGTLTNGGDINCSGTTKTKNLSVSGWANITNARHTGTTTAENLKVSGTASIQNLSVLGKMDVDELLIRQLEARGGISIHSAGTATIDAVEESDDGNGNVLYWECYQLAKDGNGVWIDQPLQANDLVVSVNFNRGKVGAHTTATYNAFYWRKVTKVTNIPTVRSDGKYYYSFVISNTTGKGTASPSVGDNLCVLGNTSDTERQNAVIVSACGSLDDDLSAPSIAQYKGINNFDLSSHRVMAIGFDSDGNPSNTFVGSFVVRSSTGTETPMVREMGEWNSDTEYEYYDRVSYKGSLYLMTNKGAGSTTQLPTGSDWTLQVSKGAQGESGASISIKGNAVAHYATIAAIPSTAEGEYLVDTCTEMGETRRRVIATMSGGSYVACEVAEDGDSYITSDDGHLWTAAAGSTTWTDCGQIQGERGADGAQGATGAKGDKGEKGDQGQTGAKGDKGDKGDQGDPGADGENAVEYVLVPNGVKIKLNAKADGTVNGSLDYSVFMVEGGTYTLQALSDDLYWRWKTELSTSGWNNVTESGAIAVSYAYSGDDGDASDYIMVQLIKEGSVLDAQVVDISVGNDAFMEVNTDLGKIKLTAQSNAEAIGAAQRGLESLSQSSLELEGTVGTLSTKVGTEEKKIEALMQTSVQFDPDTGKVTSAVKLSADNITLEGAVTANNEFQIDDWGNVKTGVQAGVLTTDYIVEDKSNLVFDKACKIYLPNDPEYIGRRVMIIAEAKHNSAGVLTDKDNDYISSVNDIAAVEIRTGRTYVNHVYYNTSKGGVYTNDDDKAKTGAKSLRGAFEGSEWFGGDVAMQNSKGHWVLPDVLTLAGGYIELLGVPYSVSNTYIADEAVVEDSSSTTGYIKYTPYITRDENGYIDDTNDNNGMLHDEETNESVTPAPGADNSPWVACTEICRWVVISGGGTRFDKDIE